MLCTHKTASSASLVLEICPQFNNSFLHQFSSIFGGNCINTLRGICYKLQMMGVSVDGPLYIYGDNMSVINNMQKPESVLRKKSNSICYHAIRESVAMGESLTAHVATTDNYANLATKTITNKPKRVHLVGGLLMDVYDQR